MGQLTLTGYLAAFFPDEKEQIHLRALGPKKAPTDDARFTARQIVTTRYALSTNSALHVQLCQLNATRGLYIGVNAGGATDEEITRFNAWFMENDSRPIDEQHRMLDNVPLPPSIRIETRKSVHAYWIIEGGCNAKEWRDVQQRLIAHLDGDDKIKNPSRVMRLPFFNHVHFNEGNGELSFKRVELKEFKPERRYTIAEMQAAFPPVSEPEAKQEVLIHAATQDATKFESWDELHVEVARRIRLSRKARTNSKGWTHAPGICHGSADGTAIYVSPDGAYGCHKGCETAQIRAAYGLSKRPNASASETDVNRLQTTNCGLQESSLSDSARSKDKLDQHEGASSKLKPLRTVRLSEVSAKAVHWLWEPFIALGTFVIVEGEEEGGKTFLTLALATATASGHGFPLNSSVEHLEPAPVVLMSAEDSLAYTIKPRLESMNAPCERIIAIDEPFTLNRDGVLRLEMVLAEYAPKLVIIDPLFSYAGKINLDRDNEIRSVTGELTRLAEKYGCAICGVRHVGKAKGFGDARAAGLNGIGWRASARSVLLVGKDPDNERKRALVQTKNNLGPKYSKAIGFEIRDGQFFWIGESDLTASRILGRMLDEETRSEQNEATTFLLDALSGGEREAKEVEKEAEKFGITSKQLRTARISIRVNWRREGFGQGSKIFWRLPPIVDPETP